jgi:hypothetical protein
MRSAAPLSSRHSPMMAASEITMAMLPATRPSAVATDTGTVSSGITGLRMPTSSAPKSSDRNAWTRPAIISRMTAAIEISRISGADIGGGVYTG